MLLRTMGMRVLNIPVFLALSLAASAQIMQPGRIGSTSVLSSSQRFLVTGGNKVENLNAALWIEETAEKVDFLTGGELHIERGNPLHLDIRPEDPSLAGRILTSGRFLVGRIEQSIILPSFAQADRESLLEEVTDLLVSRLLSRKAAFLTGSEDYINAPDWYSIGLAQNATSDLRARNQYVALREWEEGRCPGVRDLLFLEFLPSGRWKNKAFCGVLFDWLSSRPDWPDVRSGLLDALAKGETVSADMLAERMDDISDGRELEQAWDLWVVSLRQKRNLWSLDPAFGLNELQDVLTIDPQTVGLSPQLALPQTMVPRDLIGARNEPWSRTLTTFLSARLASAVIGQAAEVRQVAEAYQSFFEALLWSPPRNRMARLFAHPPSDRELSELLRKADLLLDQLNVQVRQRQDYLDQYIEETFDRDGLTESRGEKPTDLP
ncbi:MAG: hypothetical protein KJ626_07185 [Verrucomicrobia bacterium]|nr:hypothetical protein [Verrucomicrobiota bacterium]